MWHVEHTIDFCASVKNLAGMVCKSGQVGAIFLAWNRLGHLAFLDIEDLDGFIVPGGHQVFTLVIEIQRRYIVGAVLFLSIECLKIISPTRLTANPAERALYQPCLDESYE